MRRDLIDDLPMFDAYVRLRLGELHAIQPRHVCSGTDVGPELALRRDDTLTGFTEWADDSARVLSIGWDWSLHASSPWPVAHWATLRTNIMLTGDEGGDLGPEWTQRCVADRMSRVDWAAEVVQQLMSHRD